MRRCSWASTSGDVVVDLEQPHHLTLRIADGGHGGDEGAEAVGVHRRGDRDPRAQGALEQWSDGGRGRIGRSHDRCLTQAEHEFQSPARCSPQRGDVVLGELVRLLHADQQRLEALEVGPPRVGVAVDALMGLAVDEEGGGGGDALQLAPGSGLDGAALVAVLHEKDHAQGRKDDGQGRDAELQHQRQAHPDRRPPL